MPGPRNPIPGHLTMYKRQEPYDPTGGTYEIFRGARRIVSVHWGFGKRGKIAFLIDHRNRLAAQADLPEDLPFLELKRHKAELVQQLEHAHEMNLFSSGQWRPVALGPSERVARSAPPGHPGAKEGLTAMAFENIAPSRNANGVPIRSASICAAIHRSGDKPNVLAISLGLEILNKLNAKVGDRLTIAEGAGDDLGYFQVRKAQPGEPGFQLSRVGGFSNSKDSVAQSQAGGRITIRLGALKHIRPLTDFPNGYPTTEVEHNIFNRTATIMIPWLVESA